MTKTTEGPTTHDLRVELRPLTDIKPYDRNPRQNDAAVEAVARSLAEFGFRQPIVVDGDGIIVVGHTRYKAAQKLGIDRVPVHVATDLTPEQAKAYRIADNQTATIATWDFELLPLELADLNAADIDLSALGFSAAELDRLLHPPGEVIEDTPPEPPADPVTRVGDVWVLGRHRLVCGDATKPEDVARALDGRQPMLMVTDPPYGVAYDPEWRKQAGINNSDRMGKVSNDDRVDWREAYALFPGDVAYIWHAGRFTSQVADSIEACGFEVRAQIIWRKSRFAISRGHYHWQHEPAWYAVRQGKTAHWCGDRSQTTIWDIANVPDAGTTTHGTQKPVEAMARPMRNHESEVVYDPFLGSGTSLMAAEQLGRTCVGLEIDPAYCDAIAQRWENFTQQKAKHVLAGAG